jgi:tagatose-6-phosphate ketose/aldose isomerase
MPKELNVPAETGLHSAPLYTLQEILQQPLLWPNTVESVLSASERMQLPVKLPLARVLLTGAGTSAYAASAIASAWPRALAVPTTDLLIDAERYLH